MFIAELQEAERTTRKPKLLFRLLALLLFLLETLQLLSLLLFLLETLQLLSLLL